MKKPVPRKPKILLPTADCLNGIVGKFYECVKKVDITEKQSCTEEYNKLYWNCERKTEVIVFTKP